MALFSIWRKVCQGTKGEANSEPKTIGEHPSANPAIPRRRAMKVRPTAPWKKQAKYA
jgi:hypothetical protein